MTAAAVAERDAAMFVVGAKGALASGLPRAASHATNLLVHLVAQHVKAYSKEHVNALSRSFGNFDRVVAQGWLVADALGLPLLERHDAFVLGSAVRNRAKALKTKMGEKADEAFVHAAVDPPLPVPDARAAATAAVSGKRAREEPESSAAQLPVSRLRQIAKRAAAADAAAHEAREAAMAAWAASQAADDRQEAAWEAACKAVEAAEAVSNEHELAHRHSCVRVRRRPNTVQHQSVGRVPEKTTFTPTASARTLVCGRRQQSRN